MLALDTEKLLQIATSIHACIFLFRNLVQIQLICHELLDYGLGHAFVMGDVD